MAYKSEQRRRRANQQRKSAKLLPSLVASFGGRCYWCLRPVAVRRCLQQVVRHTHTHVWYRIGETVIRSRIATADHVQPLGQGGTSVAGNLVPACVQCNAVRNGQGGGDRLPPKACRQCGELRYSCSRYCKPCQRRLGENWLRYYGWDFWPNSPLDGYWQDPRTMFLTSYPNALETQRARIRQEHLSSLAVQEPPALLKIIGTQGLRALRFEQRFREGWRPR